MEEAPAPKVIRVSFVIAARPAVKPPSVPRKRRRSLYECENARVKGKGRAAVIYCKAGYLLVGEGKVMKTGRLQTGRPLQMKVCQECPDYSSGGGPVFKNDRGWKKKQRGENAIPKTRKKRQQEIQSEADGSSG